MVDKKLSRIIELHVKLAGRMKEYDQVIGVFSPQEVLNEMRYALRALLELWEINSQADFDERAFVHAEQKVYHALLCAYHDLIDGIVIDLTISMNELAKKYPEAAHSILSSRMEMLDAINEVEEKIVESREKPEEREKLYEEELYDNWYKGLLNYRKQIDRTVTPKIIEKHNLLEKQQRKSEELQRKLEEQQRKSDARDRLMTLIGIIGALIGVIGVVLSVVALT